ncbi:MAG: hypothetical protein WCS73_10800 [Lentisphaeria bacterium]
MNFTFEPNLDYQQDAIGAVTDSFADDDRLKSHPAIRKRDSGIEFKTI